MPKRNFISKRKLFTRITSAMVLGLRLTRLKLRLLLRHRSRGGKISTNLNAGAIRSKSCQNFFCKRWKKQQTWSFRHGRHNLHAKDRRHSWQLCRLCHPAIQHHALNFALIWLLCVLGKTEHVAVVGGGEVVDNGTGLKSKTRVNKKIGGRDEMQKLTKQNECSSINKTLVMGGRCSCENLVKKQTGRDVTQTVPLNTLRTFRNLQIREYTFNQADWKVPVYFLWWYLNRM